MFIICLQNMPIMRGVKCKGMVMQAARITNKLPDKNPFFGFIVGYMSAFCAIPSPHQPKQYGDIAHAIRQKQNASYRQIDSQHKKQRAKLDSSR